ncbi:MAG: cell wall-binding repeat-containing protein [Dermatophilaceae bacterium]
MSRRRAPYRSIPLVAALVVALATGAAPSGAVAPEPEWGADALRETDALVDPAASSPQERADAYELDQSAEQAATLSAAAVTSPWSLSGSGWGHGVGMSQYGAWQMAVDGYTAPEILAHYYSGTTYDLVPDTQVISVNLLNNVASTTMSTSALSTGGGAFSVTDGTTTMSGGLGAVLTASAPSGGAGATITCTSCTPVSSVSGARLTVTWDDDRTLLSVGGPRYRDGRVSVTRSGTSATINVVAQVRLHDEYLDYVTEMPWSWHSEALRAQAAAARGYALAAYSGGIRSACDCHLYDTTVSQVFAGYPSAGNLPYWSRWTGAVRAAGSATHGYVVRHNGAIIQAFYSSSSGGRTQNNEDVWGGTPLPYLRSVSDPWSMRPANPRATWTATRDQTAMAGAFGLVDVAKLDLSRRHVSGSVRSAVATSSLGVSSAITGAQFASRLGLFSSYVTRHAYRHGGSDRYATAAAVASAVPLSAGAVVIASGEPRSLIDATVGGPLAGAVGGPILLTQHGALPPPTIAELDRRGSSVRTAYILGSSGTVSESVASTLRARGLTVIRLGGPNRYETARLVAAEVARLRPVSSVVIAAGTAIPDVVSSSGPSAALGQPILLSLPTELSPETAQSLSALRPGSAYLVGNWITDDAEAAIRAAVPGVTRLSGPDRFATAAAIAQEFAPQMSYDRLVISSGLDANLVDAISSGPLKQPMLFVLPTQIPASTRDAVQRLPRAAGVSAIGNTAAVSATVHLVVRRS